MPDSPKSSFIPKQSMGSVPRRVTRRRSFNIFGFVGTVIFLVGLILAVGVFLYKDYLQGQVEERQLTLQEKRNSVSSADIEALRELNRRIVTASSLLDNHLAPSIIFDMLEERTERDVQFTEFSYKRRPSGSVEVVLDGAAQNFNAVALQRAQFEEAQTLASVLFADFAIAGEESSGVTFSVTGEGATDALRYGTFFELNTNGDTAETKSNTPSADEDVATTTGETGGDTTLDSLEAELSDIGAEIDAAGTDTSGSTQ